MEGDEMEDGMDQMGMDEDGESPGQIVDINT
jgi:hypothetical protein